MQVYLKSSSSSSHVVAKGRVKSLNPNSVVGNKKVGRNWSEVVIEVVLKRNEMLLRKHSLLRTLEDAIGVAVVWPCSLIYSVCYLTLYFVFI